MTASDLLELVKTGGAVAVLIVMLVAIMTGKLRTEREFHELEKRLAQCEQTTAAYKELAFRTSESAAKIAMTLTSAALPPQGPPP